MSFTFATTLKKKYRTKKICPQSFHLDSEENQQSLLAKLTLKQIGDNQQQKEQAFINNDEVNSWINQSSIPTKTQYLQHSKPTTSFLKRQSNRLYSTKSYIHQSNYKYSKGHLQGYQEKRQSRLDKKVVKINLNNQNIKEVQYPQNIKARKYCRTTSKHQNTFYNTSRSSNSQLNGYLRIIDIDGQKLKQTKTFNQIKSNQNQCKRNKVKSHRRLSTQVSNSTVLKHNIYDDSPLYTQFKKIKQYLKKQGLKNNS